MILLPVTSWICILLTLITTRVVCILCPAYTSSSRVDVIVCSFQICGSAYLTASNCPAYGGDFTGDPYGYLYLDSTYIDESDDLSAGVVQCFLFVNKLISLSSGQCATINIRQSCYDSSVPCGGTTAYIITSFPTVSPTVEPTIATAPPTRNPTSQPSNRPSSLPTVSPTMQPSSQPSLQPMNFPSTKPTAPPSVSPSSQPSVSPSCQPSCKPTCQLSVQPSSPPSSQPTTQPSLTPTLQPTHQPTLQPSTLPTAQPTRGPSCSPSGQPSVQPSSFPSFLPNSQPSSSPSSYPTCQPSKQPSSCPTLQPSNQPSIQPSMIPTSQPTNEPTAHPSVYPTSVPSRYPTASPSSQPSNQPSNSPTSQPGGLPSLQPTSIPSSRPSIYPSSQPSLQPSQQPSELPTVTPTSQPTSRPSYQPTMQPTIQPTQMPVQIANKLSESLSEMFRSNSSIFSTNQNQSLTNVFVALEDVIGSLYPSLVSLLANKNTNANNSILQSMSFSADSLTTTLAILQFPNLSTTNSSSKNEISISLANSNNFLVLDLFKALSTQPDVSLGMIVSVVQLAASYLTGVNFWESNNNHSNNKSSSSNSSVVSLTQPQLASDIISIQLTYATSNGSTLPVAIPSFDAVIQMNDNSLQADIQVLRYNCTYGIEETVFVLCQQSNIMMNLTCTGYASAMVHRKCPVPRHVCSVLNLEDNTIASNDYCEAIVTGSTMLCRCGYDNNNQNNDKNVSSLLALKGRVSVAAFSFFAGGELDTSITKSASMLSGNIAEKSLLVFVTFGCLWGFAIVLVGFEHYKTIVWNKQKANHKMAKVKPQSGHVIIMNDGNIFQQYIQSILPPCLQQSEDTWWVFRITSAVSHRHLVLRIAKQLWQSSKTDQERSKTMLDLLELVTALTMSCFALAVLYDVQYPVDDGYCAAQRTKDACLVRKSLLDATVSRCVWLLPYGNADQVPSAAFITESLYGQSLQTISIDNTYGLLENDEAPCTMNPNILSQTAFVIAFLISSVFMTLLTLALEYVFSVLHHHARVKNHNNAAPQPPAVMSRHNTNNQNLFTVLYESIDEVILPPDGYANRQQWLLSAHLRMAGETEDHKKDKLGIVLLYGFLSNLQVINNNNTNNNKHYFVDYNYDNINSGWHNIQGISDTSSTKQPLVMYEQTLFDRVCCRWCHIDYISSSSSANLSLMASDTGKIALVILLLLMHAGAMYFLLSKAAVRGLAWQQVFFTATLLEWVVDICVIQLIEAVVLEYFVPWYFLSHIIQRQVMFLVAMEANKNYVHSSSLTKMPERDLIETIQEAVFNKRHASYDVDRVPKANNNNNITHNSINSKEIALINELSSFSTVKVSWTQRMRQTWLQMLMSCSEEVLQAILNLLSTLFVSMIVFLWFFILKPSVPDFIKVNSNNNHDNKNNGNGNQNTQKFHASNANDNLNYHAPMEAVIFIWTVLILPAVGLLIWVVRDYWRFHYRRRTNTVLNNTNVNGSINNKIVPVLFYGNENPSFSNNSTNVNVQTSHNNGHAIPNFSTSPAASSYTPSSSEKVSSYSLRSLPSIISNQQSFDQNNSDNNTIYNNTNCSTINSRGSGKEVETNISESVGHDVAEDGKRMEDTDVMVSVCNDSRHRGYSNESWDLRSETSLHEGDSTVFYRSTTSSIDYLDL